MSTDHPLAGKKTVSFQELAEEPIIMKETGSGTSKRVNELFDQNNCVPNVLMETSNNEFIKQVVHRGEGVSFLVKACVTLELQEKKLATVPLKDQKIYLDVSFGYLKDQPLSPPAKAFENVLKKLRAEDMRPQDIGSLMAKILAQQS
jgi:DNA-binding transcriptional LysR family regulator